MSSQGDIPRRGLLHTGRTARFRSAPKSDRLGIGIGDRVASEYAPWERTRSRSRCSRWLMADSTAGCWRLASANACASSCSATESRPWRGSALKSSMASSRTWLSGLWNLRSKLYTRRSGYSACRLLDDRRCTLCVAPLPHNLVVKDELELVFNHAHGNSELRRIEDRTEVRTICLGASSLDAVRRHGKA